MSDLRSFDKACRLVFTDPKFKAQVEWLEAHNPFRDVPQHEMAHYVATGRWLNPDRHLVYDPEQMPDFDWWEPRYDQPGRREQTRYREAGL